jgi:PAS domain S-box-containing protein
LVKQTKLIGVLYIENTLTMHAFTPAQIGLLTLLASRAAISLENARLYTDLQHTQAYLAEAQRLSHTGSFAFNSATGELIWSDEVYRIYEFDRATKITWELTFQRAHPEEVNLIQKIVERVSLDGKHFNIDHRLMMSDGSVKYLHVIVHGEKDEAGGARYVGTVMDVTESKQAQERLQASLSEIQLAQSRLEEAQRIAQMGNWVWTLSTNRIVCSEEHCRIFGFSPEQLDTTYEACLKTVHPDDLRELQSTVEPAIRAGEEFSCEFRIVLPDGSIKHVHGRGGPSTVGTGDCDEYLGTVIDITERKRHEEEMQKQVSLIENSTDFIEYSQSSDRVGCNADRIEYLNAAGRRLVGLDLDEDITKYKTSDFRPPEGHQQFLDEIRPILLRDGHWAGEHTLQHFKTKAVIPVFQTIFFINDKGANRETAIATICRDISERKRIEENLRTSLEEKDALLKEVHHRVKNNLQLISSLLNLQADRVADPAVAEGFAESRNRVRSMALVHENLYRAGNLARVPMAAHIRNLCAHLVRAYGVNCQRVDLVTEIEDVELDIDRAITAGLVVNELVSNALKHAFPGNREGQVRVELKSSGEHRYVLAVTDDGIGLSAERDPDYSDTLGLQLVHDLTRQLNGTIAVQREFGTSFIIRFNVGDDQESLQ